LLGDCSDLTVVGAAYKPTLFLQPNSANCLRRAVVKDASIIVVGISALTWKKKI
jgi:hypothetical protein